MASQVRTGVSIAVAVLANSFGNLLLALAVEQLPAFDPHAFGYYLSTALHNPFLLPGILLTATYSAVQLWMFGWADLSFVVPCIASSYIVSTLLAEFILGERIQLMRWAGVLLICCGVFLVARTPVSTKPHGSEAPE